MSAEELFQGFSLFEGWTPYIVFPAMGVLLLLIVQETFGVRHYGAILGLINMSTIITFTFGPLLAGASYDLTGSYSAAFATGSVLFLCAAAVLRFTRDDTGTHLPRN